MGWQIGVPNRECKQVRVAHCACASGLGLGGGSAEDPKLCLCFALLMPILPWEGRVPQTPGRALEWFHQCMPCLTRWVCFLSLLPPRIWLPLWSTDRQWTDRHRSGWGNQCHRGEAADWAVGAFPSTGALRVTLGARFLWIRFGTGRKWWLSTKTEGVFFCFQFCVFVFARAGGSRALTSIRMIRMVSLSCFWLWRNEARRIDNSNQFPNEWAFDLRIPFWEAVT